MYEADGINAWEFKVSGINGVTGYSGTSNAEGISDDWFVRIDTLPPSAITNFFVQSVTDNSIGIIWTASADPNFAGYEIYYALTSNVSTADMLWSKLDDPNLEFAGTGLINTEITGLQPATRYYFLMRATDSAGNAAQYPQVINAMTTSSAPPSAPVNMTVQISGNNILLDWDDVTTDENNFVITISYYIVYAGDTPDFECNPEAMIDMCTQSEYSMTDVVDSVDRVFFKVKAISGSIRQGMSIMDSR
jgi:chitodextrinase